MDADWKAKYGKAKLRSQNRLYSAIRKFLYGEMEIDAPLSNG